MSDKGYKIAPVMMTPQAAVCLLETNTANRLLRPSHVEYLTKAIHRGEFRATNDAVTVLSSGVLANGQHRLTAIVKADTPAPVLLAAPSIFFVGLQETEMSADDALMAVIDCGVGRTAADRTGLPRGICELVNAWCKARRDGVRKFSAEQLLQCYVTHKRMFDWAHAMRPKDKGVSVCHVWLAFMEFFLASPGAAHTFVSDFVKEVPSIQQAALLRARLIKYSNDFGRYAGDSACVKYATYYTAICCIKKWTDGKTIKNLTPCDWNGNRKAAHHA